jgi:hypothetical protein
LAEDRLRLWETLFLRALELIDSVGGAGVEREGWTFGGGTVLMRRYRHRLSKDIDIFIPDPQYLAYLTPRLNTKAEALTTQYVEQHGFLKPFFPEGEIDFVTAGALTTAPTAKETVLGREVLVETSIEIIAKEGLWLRGAELTARDIFDLALITERESAALREIKPVLRDRREVILRRIETHVASLRETFAELEILDYHRTFDECVELVKGTLGRRSSP